MLHPLPLGNVLLESVLPLAQFGTLPHSAGQSLLPQPFLCDLFSLDPFFYPPFLFLQIGINFLETGEFPIGLLLLFPVQGCQLGLPFLFVAMPDLDGGKLALGLYLSGNRLDFFVVDDPVLQPLNIVLPWVVGMSRLRGDDGGYLSGFIFVLSFVVACPGVFSLGQSQVPDDSVVVFLLLGRHYDVSEAVGVKRSSRFLVIIGNENVGGVELSELLGVILSLGLEEGRDINILSPLLLVLLALQSFHLH